MIVGGASGVPDALENGQCLDMVAKSDIHKGRLVVDMSKDNAPDWPPRGSAYGLPDGMRQRSSVGQLWETKDGRWVRISISTTSALDIRMGTDDAFG